MIAVSVRLDGVNAGAPSTDETVIVAVSVAVENPVMPPFESTVAEVWSPVHT